MFQIKELKDANNVPMSTKLLTDVREYPNFTHQILLFCLLKLYHYSNGSKIINHLSE